MTRLRQMWAWTRFTLSEYVRSGRIFAELLAFVVFAYLFLRRPNVAAIMTATQFFTMTSTFVLAQTIYTMSMLMSMAQRGHNYVVLARSLGRRGYLFGLFLVAVIISALNFLLCSLTVTIINKPAVWTLVIWLAGALPLILDVMLVAGLVMLLSSLVLTQGWRLLILGIVALASLGSSELFTTSLNPDSTLGKLLGAVRTIVGIPLTPLLAGFELAARREYSQQAIAILLGQFVLLVAVLSFAFFAFDRRDVVLQ